MLKSIFIPAALLSLMPNAFAGGLTTGANAVAPVTQGSSSDISASNNDDDYPEYVCDSPVFNELDPAPDGTPRAQVQAKNCKPIRKPAPPWRHPGDPIDHCAPNATAAAGAPISVCFCSVTVDGDTAQPRACFDDIGKRLGCHPPNHLGIKEVPCKTYGGTFEPPSTEHPPEPPTCYGCI